MILSERSPLRVLLVLLALVLGLFGAPPAQAAPPPPSAPKVTEHSARLAPEPDAELPVAVQAQAQSEDAVVLTASAPVAEDVGIAAVTLPAGSEVDHVYVRQVADGQAGEWTEVEVEDAPNPGERLGSVPVVVAQADSVEVAVVADAPVQASLHVVSTTTTAADRNPADYAHEGPDILSRRAWSANERLVRYAYSDGSVTGAMIHHTATANDYSASDVPGILRSIQAFHVNTRGWNDIGYNVLVDRFGRAWEGRGGGVDWPVQGGHAYRVTNERTFGISAIGDFDKTDPSPAQVSTIEHVVAWKLRENNVDPYGTTWGSGGQDGGSTRLNAISGHRDENATSCPGERLYAKFGQIRANVKTLMETTYTGTGLEGFNPANLVSNADVYTNSMTRAQIQAVLDQRGASCVGRPDGAACLKDYRTNIPATGATATCSAVGALSGAGAADVFARVASACRVSPQALISVVQARYRLVTASGMSLTEGRYNNATGAGCTAFGTCDPAKATFFGQVYGAAETLRATQLGQGTFVAGRAAQVPYSPELVCGAASLTPANHATAAVYNHFRYISNKASLDSGMGTGDICSTHGVREFHRTMSGWFGSASVGAPIAPTPVVAVPEALTKILAHQGTINSATRGDATGPVVCENGLCTKPYARGSITWSKDAGAAWVVPTERLAGQTRYATAALVSERGFPGGASTVFIATGGGFADALAAGPWANRLQSPILLVSRDALPAETRTELARLKPQRIVLLGGPLSVDASVEQALRTAVPGATVQRISGATRYATAARASSHAFESAGEVFLASGEMFPDALVGGPLSAGNGPILLAPSQGGVPVEVQTEIKRLGATRVTILGGTNWIPKATQDALSAQGLAVERIAGPSRYDTAARVAQRAFTGDVERIYLANGENFPDALVAVGLQTSAPGPLLLSQPTCVPKVTLDYINARPKAKVTLIGGPSNLSDAVATLRGC